MRANLSSAEEKVANWLTQRRITFIPQQNMMGGQSVAGGAKVDFVLPLHNIIIRVQSYWHTMEPALARDKLQRIALENQGYIVVDVYEDDLEENLNRVMNAALRGEEVWTR